jgi:hypothetical protein
MSQAIETSSAALEAYTASLQTGWDDIEDVPDYVQLVSGSYKGVVTAASIEAITGTEGREDVGISKLTVQITECLEEGAVTEGVVGGLAGFGFVGETGKKFIKKSMWEVIQTLGVTNIADLWEQLPGKEVLFVVKNTYSKPDAEGNKKTFSNLQVVTLA